MRLPRRRLLAMGLAQAGLLTFAPSPTWAAAALRVENVTGLYGVSVAAVQPVYRTQDVVDAVLRGPFPIAVGGGRFSMGGQIAAAGGLHLDMRPFKGLIWLRPDDLRVRVQAGMRWRDLQEHLDPLGLAVHTMQSYANFSVGGSVSVNVHGRYLGHGPLAHSVWALQLVLADGRVVEADRQHNADLFAAALGGYGAVGVITEVELQLARNRRIRREVQEVALEAYPAHFRDAVLSRPGGVLHNADLLPPHFDKAFSLTWREAADDAPLTEPARLVARGQRYAVEQNLIWAFSELPGAMAVREAVLEPLLRGQPAVKWLNHEASLDVAQLEPRTRRWSTYALQEYFVPERHFLSFATGLGALLRQHKAGVLNVSIRHAPADRDALLKWAPEPVFCFVLYFKQRRHAQASAEVGRWTRALIDLALQHEGRYYLPYQPHATREQFEAAYPQATQLRALKARVDAEGRFNNSLWQRYL